MRAMVEENGQQQGVVQPAPIPATVATSIAKDDNGKTWIVLAVADFAGTHFTFIEPEHAKTIGRSMVDVATQANNSGLVIPRSEEVVSFEAMRMAREREEHKHDGR